MKKFKRFKNDPLQIIGSIVAVVSAWFIAMPAVKYFRTGTLEFSFFGLITGNAAMAIWIVLFLAGPDLCPHHSASGKKDAAAG